MWEISREGVQERWSLSAQETGSGVVGVAFSPDGTRVMAGDAGVAADEVAGGGSSWKAPEWGQTFPQKSACAELHGRRSSET